MTIAAILVAGAIAITAILALAYVIKELLRFADTLNKVVVSKHNAERFPQAGNIFNAGFAESMARGADIWRDNHQVAPAPDMEPEPHFEEEWHTVGSIPINGPDTHDDNDE